MQIIPKNEPKQFIDFYNNIKCPNCGSARIMMSSKDSKYVVCKDCNEKIEMKKKSEW